MTYQVQVLILVSSIFGQVLAPKEIDTIQSKFGTLLILFRGVGRYKKLEVLLFLTSVKVIKLLLLLRVHLSVAPPLTSSFDPAICFFKTFLIQIVQDLKEYGIMISLHSQKLNQIAIDCI